MVSDGKTGTTLTAATLAGAAETLVLKSAATAEMGNSLLFVPHSEARRAYVPPVAQPLPLVSSNLSSSISCFNWKLRF